MGRHEPGRMASSGRELRNDHQGNWKSRIACELARDHPSADTILAPGPQIPFATRIEAVEQKSGKTVVSALQSQLWHCLRLCGVDDSITGYGRLLRDHG